jgi:hypothetical protein
MSVRFAYIATAVAVAFLLFSGGCGEDPAEPEEDFCYDMCIGPQGGTTAFTDPDHPMYGTSVTVPAGAWNKPYLVYLGYETTFTTPNFPDGLEGYRGMLTGSLNIEISVPGPPDETPPPAPDNLYMEITFPTRGLTTEEGQIVVAYRYDEAVKRWRIELPDAQTDSTITVHTTMHSPQWTFGILTIPEADWDLYIEPIMQESHGSDEWTQVQLELINTYRSIFDNDLSISCASLDFAYTMFSGVRDSAESEIQAHQASLGSLCRQCDVTSSLFWNEYIDYIALNIEAFFIELLFVDNGPTLLIQVYGFMRLCETLAEIDELTCDYECFWKNADRDFYSAMSVYYVATGVMKAVEYAKSSGYINCPG